jgi:diguanylate cyclase (GGDEF)-like protein
VADALKKGLRRQDVLCRFGGEEMVALLPDMTLPIAIEVAERLRESLERSAFAELGEMVTASFGVASRRAKKAGRNRVVSAASL